MQILTRLRTSEYIFLSYFAYVAILSLLFRLDTATVVKAWAALSAIFALFAILTMPRLRILRDWTPIVLVLAAYREMDWFSFTEKTRALERHWLAWDHQWLFDRGFRSAIESLGAFVPGLLEFTYLLVYGIAAFSVGTLYVHRKEDRVDRFLTVYLGSTLLSYALFPYFPSDPPRVVFPGADMPTILTPLRVLNLSLVGDYGIHSSVFPSAHVSSAFGAAWGLLLFMPERPASGWGMLIYACLVAVATVYGRYHYGVDAVAGFAVSLIALAIGWRMRSRHSPALL